MTNSNFKEAKAELLSEMLKKKFCRESIIAVKYSKDLEQLSKVLINFRVNLREENFPKLNWFRKWFESEDLIRYNIYLDTDAEVKGIFDNVFILGDSNVSITSDVIRMQYVFARDNSNVKVNAKGFSIFHVTIKDGSTINVTKERNARVIISDKRK